MGKNMGNTKVFGYVRVSTTGQVKAGFSLEQHIVPENLKEIVEDTLGEQNTA